MESVAGTTSVGGSHKHRCSSRMVTRDVAEHPRRSELDCRNGRRGCDRRFDLAQLSALAQYVVLRDHVRPSAWWIPINMAAWLVGIVWTLLPSPWVDQSTSTGALIFIYGIAGLCMAATVAVITGLGMIRLLRPLDAARSASLAGSEHADGVLDGTSQRRKESEFS